MKLEQRILVVDDDDAIRALVETVIRRRGFRVDGARNGVQALGICSAMNEPRVLIVESDNALRAMLFTILRHQPVGVDTAASADDAFDKVTNCDYAMIIIDMDVPDASRFLVATHAPTRFSIRPTSRRC